MSNTTTTPTVSTQVSDKATQLIFSLVSGEIFEIEEDELKNLQAYQIPIIRRPKESCRGCYGRGHKGFNTKSKLYLLCAKCMKSCIDFEKLQLFAKTHTNELS